MNPTKTNANFLSPEQVRMAFPPPKASALWEGGKFGLKVNLLIIVDNMLGEGSIFSSLKKKIFQNNTKVSRNCPNVKPNRKRSLLTTDPLWLGDDEVDKDHNLAYHDYSRIW